VGVHSFTLSYTPESTKCDLWDSPLAYTFTSPCLGHKLKARVAKARVAKARVATKIMLFIIEF
jgi:hypothetical protein